jgi:DNA (cytosine-5)-methyltransferase 1
VTAQRNKSVTVAHLSKYYGTSTGCAVDEPAPTITAGGDRAGIKLALVHAFLTRYNGQSIGQAAEAPLGTLDTTDRYAVVTVKIDGEDYIIADIGMRMLTPRELYRCQGFRPDYKIDVLRDDGEPLTKTAQVRMVGNSVSPYPARAVVAAQFQEAA